MQFHPIGIIHTPYTEHAPRQSITDAEGVFYISIDPANERGLFRLEKHSYIFVIYWLDRQTEPIDWVVTPHHGQATPVGLFASRTPLRPNPIGLSLVKLLGVDGNILHISGIDALDGTPVLDIKPYYPGLDSTPLKSFNPPGDS